MSDVVQHLSDVLQQMRFQFSSALGHPEWERLGNLEFARALYVEVRGLQERCGRAESMIEKARAALAPEPQAPSTGPAS